MDGATPNAPALKDLWEQARRSSAIHSEGLFASENNRLRRVVRAAAGSHTTTERRELTTFIEHVTRAGTVIDPGWRQRILTYATALQSTLGR